MGCLSKSGKKLFTDGYVFELCPKGWFVSAGGQSQWLADRVNIIARTNRVEAFSAMPTQNPGLLLVPDSCTHSWVLPMARLDNTGFSFGFFDLHRALRHMGVRLVGGQQGAQLMALLLRAAHEALADQPALQGIVPSELPERCSAMERSLFALFLGRDVA